MRGKNFELRPPLPTKTFELLLQTSLKSLARVVMGITCTRVLQKIAMSIAMYVARGSPCTHCLW